MKDLLKILGGAIGFLSYSLPFIFNSVYIDLIYTIGVALGFGLVLIGVSYKPKTIPDKITTSAGVYFIGLSLIFLFNNITDLMFNTYWYVMFNTLITIICFVLLIFRIRSTRQ